MTESAGYEIHWCDDPGVADQIADMFVRGADVSYISHSEIQFGLAASPSTWAPDLRERQMHRVVSVTRGGDEGVRLATVTDESGVIGFAFVKFVTNVGVPFATLEDFLVAQDRRGTGLGTRFLRWIVSECRDLGARRMFLESGMANREAHDFFERNSFKLTSITMMADL